MTVLRELPLDGADAHVLGPRAAAWAQACDARLDELLAGGLRERLPCFAPADPRVVDHALASAGLPRRALFLEWGSATGLVGGLAALRGLRAHGIEVVPELAEAALELAAQHGLGIDVACGSFVPDDWEADAEHALDVVGTVADAAPGYDVLERDLDEFDAVYAYPWPGAEGWFEELFVRHAVPGTLFVTYHGQDGCRVRSRI